MRKGNYVIYYKNSLHINKLNIGKIYESSSSSSVFIDKNMNHSSYIESSNIVPISKNIYKNLIKNYSLFYLEEIFKDISNFINKYEQTYLQKNSFGFLEHRDKINNELIPYLYNQKKLFKKDIFDIINLFKNIDINDFEKIIDINLNILNSKEKLYVSEINDFFKNITITSSNVYKNGLIIINKFYPEKNQKKIETTWKLERLISSVSGYEYDHKYYSSQLISFYIDIINDIKSLNINKQCIDDYIDKKLLISENIDYMDNLELKDEKGFRNNCLEVSDYEMDF